MTVAANYCPSGGPALTSWDIWIGAACVVLGVAKCLRLSIRAGLVSGPDSSG
jgi:hypothetical protein